MKDILVTGANGFIGSHVVELLPIFNCNPIIFDRFRKNGTSEKYSNFLGDIRNHTAVSEAVSISDGVIHLAGVLGTAETISNPIPSIDTNVYGSLNVFQACKQYDKKCVYISVGNHWMNNSYSITKSTAERFAWMFNRELDTKIAVVRGLNAYGPRQKHAPVRKIIPNFIIPALKGKAITVYGDGSQIMDMIFVRDLAKILIRALLVEHNNYVYDPIKEGIKTPRFEAGTGNPTTVKEIAKTVIKLVGNGSIKNVPMRAGEPPKAVVLGDPETLRPLYSGEIPAFVGLEDGLKTTIEYFRKLVEAGEV